MQREWTCHFACSSHFFDRNTEVCATHTRTLDDATHTRTLDERVNGELETEFRIWRQRDHAEAAPVHVDEATAGRRTYAKINAPGSWSVQWDIKFRRCEGSFARPADTLSRIAGHHRLPNPHDGFPRQNLIFVSGVIRERVDALPSPTVAAGSSGAGRRVSYLYFSGRQRSECIRPGRDFQG